MTSEGSGSYSRPDTGAIRLAQKAREDYRHAKMPHQLMEAAGHIPALCDALAAAEGRERRMLRLLRECLPLAEADDNERFEDDTGSNTLSKEIAEVLGKGAQA